MRAGCWKFWGQIVYAPTKEFRWAPAAVKEGTHDEALKAPTALTFLFLLLGLHHYFSQFFEVLWLLDGALESNMFSKIVMTVTFSSECISCKIFMSATMNMVQVDCKKSIHEHDSEQEKNRFSPLSFKFKWFSRGSILEFSDSIRTIIAFPEAEPHHTWNSK